MINCEQTCLETIIVIWMLMEVRRTIFDEIIVYVDMTHTYSYIHDTTKI